MNVDISECKSHAFSPFHAAARQYKSDLMEIRIYIHKTIHILAVKVTFMNKTSTVFTLLVWLNK